MADRYDLRYTEKAAGHLEELSKVIAAQIPRKLEWLAENAPDLKHEAMKGN